MPIELRPTAAADIPELGRICYEAFKDIAESHGFPPDFPSAEFAAMVIGLLVQQEAVYASSAWEGDAARGSNHIALWDEVAGLGPISVDIGAQGQGIGRTLMVDAIDHARSSGFERVRLMQDSFNMRSLALYASLGFDTKEPVAYMELSPAGPIDAGFRAATQDDLAAMDELCRAVYHVSRTNEVSALMSAGFPAFVIDRGGIRGYVVATAIGHGVAEDDGVMLALLASLGASAANALTNVPIRQGELYRRALSAGHRNRKVMNLMALGPYEDPQGVWLPSVLF